MRRILLHICCAPCSIHSIDILKSAFHVTGYFYNPNIHPKNEYLMRLNELKRLADWKNIEIFEGEYTVEKWDRVTKGHEYDSEGGERCIICYRMRLKKCAEFAREKRIEYFTTVLSISPHKNTQRINRVGNEVAKTYGVAFFEADFKKKNGFALSAQKSKELGLVRQNYCGCRYSKR